MGDEAPITGDHILMRRLFDSTSADLQGEFHLDDWELAHLNACEECQHIRDVFARQFLAMKARAAGSNDVA
jgi:hypothetical protein